MVLGLLRIVNDYGDKAMNWMRDKAYAPALRFTLKNQFFAFALFVGALLLTIGSVGGGVIGVTLFPQISSDQVSVTLE